MEEGGDPPVEGDDHDMFEGVSNSSMTVEVDDEDDNLDVEDDRPPSPLVPTLQRATSTAPPISVVEEADTAASTQAATTSSAPDALSSVSVPVAFSSVAAVVRVGHKRKAVDERDSAAAKASLAADDDEEGVVCNICMEPWTNSGEHRIASLRCGHFFGHSCIEKWLKPGGSCCPNCNEKATKRDLRVHYVSRLMAIDTSERDRAMSELEKARMEQRQLELELTTLKVTLKLQSKEIDRLKQELTSQGLPVPSNCMSVGRGLGDGGNTSAGADNNHSLFRLAYLKRLEIIRSVDSTTDRDKCCRVMAYNDFYGMLIVSQPSFTALAPGYGIRKISMLDQKVGPFLSLHKEPIRDLAFHPVRQDQLLSASQEKCVKLTNVNTGHVVQKYSCDSEAWSCCWNLDDANQFFVGTKRSQVLLFDTREGDVPKQQLEFPVPEHRPIIGLAYVPQQQQHSSFPSSGLLVLTLGSLWFFERVGSTELYQAHKLPIDGPFWSMRFDMRTRMLLVSTKPTPHARHAVCELNRVNVSADPALHPDFVISCNVICDQTRGGSYSDRSFLRSSLFTHPRNDQQLLIAYGRGSGNSDHVVKLQEIGAEKFKQEIATRKPVLDICPLAINGDHFLAILCETDLILYKWLRPDQ